MELAQLILLVGFIGTLMLLYNIYVYNNILLSTNILIK